MITDPKNALTFTSLFVAKAQATNNTASVGMDTRGYIGKLAVRVNLGIKTAGDNDGAVTVIIQASADNTAANAVNIASTNGLGDSTANVATTNNTAASGTLSVNPRAFASGIRYLFARIILAGTNSPSYPVAVEVVGTKQVQ